MTFPLKELSRLLAQDNTCFGVVVEIDNAILKVATPQGAMTLPAEDRFQFKKGDRVLVKNGRATKAPVARLTLSV